MRWFRRKKKKVRLSDFLGVKYSSLFFSYADGNVKVKQRMAKVKQHMSLIEMTQSLRTIEFTYDDTKKL